MKRVPIRTEKRWAIESPAHGLLVFAPHESRREVARYVKYEKGRRVVRVTLTWRGRAA